MSARFNTSRRGYPLTPSRLPGLSVVIPVYRSEMILPELVERLGRILEEQGTAYEIVLVNDGSPDRSWEVINQLAHDHAFIVPINLMRNYGQHNALLCGIRVSKYNLIITMDDDLQHPPEKIPALLSKLAEGFDVVYGTPKKQQHGFWRDLASFLTKLALESVMGADIARQVCAFRAFRGEVAEGFVHYEGAYVSIDVLLTWGTNRFAAVSVEHEPRKQGVSGYTFHQLVRHAMNMVTGFSTLPLQVASLVGFAFMFFGVGVLVYVLIRYLLQGTPLPGFPFLASIIALFAGAQLFALGVLGEYLARIHFRSMQKPPYVVRIYAEDQPSPGPSEEDHPS